LNFTPNGVDSTAKIAELQRELRERDDTIDELRHEIAVLRGHAGRPRQIFGSREQHLLWQLSWYAEHEDVTFDVTFYSREPILEVTLDKDFTRKFVASLMFGKTATRTAELLTQVAFSDGTTVSVRDIWTFNYMPRELDLTTVDLAEGETAAGANGETIRTMIRDTYHCKTRAEEGFFLNRWLAS